MPKSSDILFVRIPKNASTSVYQILGEQNYVQRNLDVFYDEVFNSVYCRNFFCPSHQSFYALWCLLGEDVRRARSFAVVRDPLDRLVSMYAFTKKYSLHELYDESPMTFPEFVIFICGRKYDPTFFHAHSQMSWLVDETGQIAVDEILQFSNLNTEFPKLMTRWGAPLKSGIPHSNSTKHEHYSSYYDKHLARHVFRHYQEDFSLLETWEQQQQ